MAILNTEKIRSVLDSVGKGLSMKIDGSAHTILKTTFAALKPLSKVEAVEKLRIEALVFKWKT